MFFRKKKDTLKQLLDYNKDGLVNVQDIIDASKDLEKSLQKYRDTLKKTGRRQPEYTQIDHDSPWG